MVTNYGTMTMELYNETPLHRDNFIKLINEKVYDSLLFHRVIETFMIQGGDPDSKNATPEALLGEGDLGYTVEAEFSPDLFHKKGALATAREESLSRASSAVQFFIVQGKVFNDSLLDHAESRINSMLARHHVINDSTYRPLWNDFIKAIESENENQAMTLNDSINTIAKTYTNFENYTIPNSHRNVYKTVGGTPHLDQNYTVFGQVIDGMEVIDSIAATKTGEGDRPISDVRILSVRLKD
jgi:peptidyl-prolyl cis-trans isomerase B (cyclophilin B)